MMVSLLASIILQSGPAVYVSLTGTDTNPGTAWGKPLRTFEAARDKARGLHSHEIVVEGNGAYRLERTLALDARDNGLTITAASGTRPSLDGGILIPPDAIKPCGDPLILNRIIDERARSKVQWVDLAALGVTSLPPIQAYGFPHPPGAAPNELFWMHLSPMTLARWPNTGYTMTGSVIEPGNGENDRDKPQRKPVFTGTEDRAKLWIRAEDPWLYGYWKYDWADESIKVQSIDPSTGAITLANPHVYGVDKGKPYYAENLLEELDTPGEYWIDRVRLRAYFILPSIRMRFADGHPGPVISPQLEVSTLPEPLITINDASKVTIRGLDLCISRGDGVWIRNCESTRLVDCHLYSLGGRGAEVDGGHDCGLETCDIYLTGEGGVALGGGDRKTLEPGRNFVDDCDIHHFERRSQTYRPAVLISGVGNRVSHCAMHDAPHSAIIFSGNDHIIEYNDFYNTISRTGDGGVVYTGRDWTARGTQIRYNYFRNNVGLHQWEPAIYVDDLGSGIVMKGNLIVGCHWGFLIGGGRDNVIEDNTIIGCKLAFDCDARGLGWAKSSLPTMMAGLNAVPYKSEPWHSRYPALADILDHDPLAPSGNVLRDNLLVRSGKVEQQMEAAFKKTATIEGNVETDSYDGPRLKPPKGAGLRHGRGLILGF
ncbi:MAG TPA: right-handed parallel beta-helix repeat-containing protein [Fimbriimonadaceae bacterium]|nr:right-handed parallel beta-helix repeat-containing protein [Fimbriimonadaceae bacterium]